MQNGRFMWSHIFTDFYPTHVIMQNASFSKNRKAGACLFSLYGFISQKSFCR